MYQVKDPVTGPIFWVRLGDLECWHRLEVRCFRCGHQAEFTPKRLRKWVVGRLTRGWAGPAPQDWIDRQVNCVRIVELGKRLKCEVCDNKGQNSYRVIRLAR